MSLIDPTAIMHLLSVYGYAAIFLMVMLESAGIPLPGETILVSAAIYASTMHGLDIRLVVTSAAIGAILGDNIGFWIGREFGPRLLARWGDRFGLDARKQKLGQFLFMKYGGQIVFFGRFVAVLRTFAALLAGINRLSPLRFFLFNASGGILWAGLFGFAGYMLGEGLRHVAGPLGWVALAGALVGALAFWRFYKRHEERFLIEAARAVDAAHPAGS